MTSGFNLLMFQRIIQKKINTRNSIINLKAMFEPFMLFELKSSIDEQYYLRKDSDRNVIIRIMK